MLTLALLSLLSQTEVPAADASAAERAAAAAERAAVAAQKAAEAAQKMIEAQLGTPAAPEAAPVEGEPKMDPWKGSVGIGLIAITGNAETLTGTFNAAVDKKVGNWAFGGRASAAYGQSRPAAGGPDQVSAMRAGLLLRGDRSLVSFASLFLIGGVETDHVKSVELREFAELGAGIRFYELKEGELERVFIRADLGLRYSHESRFQYYSDGTIPGGTGLPSANLLGPRIGVIFRYALNKHVKFSEEAEFIPNLLGASRFIVNSTTKLNARLTETLSISASFLVNFDSAPAAGKRDTDTALTIGLEAAF